VFGAAVDAGYFRVMRVEIARGRAFTDDDRAGSRRVATVNQQFARTYWPNQDPIGRRLRLDRSDGPEAEVVGVARTGHYLFVNEAPEPYVYVPYSQNPRPQMTLIVQSAGDPSALAAPLRDLVRSIDSNLPMFNLRPVANLYESRATGTWLQLFQMVGSMASSSRPPASMGSSLTPSAAASRNSGYASPSARAAVTWCGLSSAAGCCSPARASRSAERLPCWRCPCSRRAFSESAPRRRWCTPSFPRRCC